MGVGAARRSAPLPCAVAAPLGQRLRAEAIGCCCLGFCCRLEAVRFVRGRREPERCDAVWLCAASSGAGFYAARQCPCRLGQQPPPVPSFAAAAPVAEAGQAAAAENARRDDRLEGEPSLHAAAAEAMMETMEREQHCADLALRRWVAARRR
jgi:hypothetical protein